MPTRKILAGTLLAIIMSVMQSCYYDNEAELYPKTKVDTVVSYSKRIVPILTTPPGNCTTCHTGTSPSGGFRLETYDEVKAIALDKSKGPEGRLYGAVAHISPPYAPMPQGGQKLPDANIADIKKWVDQGAQNN
jgi:hypothetical protein